jgi:hypothetical protein
VAVEADCVTMVAWARKGPEKRKNKEELRTGWPLTGAIRISPQV